MPRSRSLLITAAATALVASGCSSGGSASSSSTSAAAPGPSALASASGTVQVTLWESMGGTNGKALQSLVTQFNSAHAGKIHVTAVYQGSYVDNLAEYSAAVRAGKTPSLLLTNDVTTGFMADSGQTVAAQDLAAANPGTITGADLEPAARSYYTVNGKLMALPFNTSMPVLYVNDDLLAKAGIATDTPMTTFAQVAAVAKKVKAAVPSAYGFDEPYDGWYPEQLIASTGQTPCAPDNGRKGTRVTGVNLTGSAQTGILSQLVDLYTGGVALNTGTDSAQAATAFAAGKVALMYNSSASLGSLGKSASFHYSVLPYPVNGDASTSGPIIGGAALWVDKVGHSSAEQVASWQFASFLDSAASQQAFSSATGYIPVSVGTAALPAEKTALAANPNLDVLVKQLANTPSSAATAGCLTGALSSVRTIVISALQGAVDGSSTLSSALSSAQSKADQAITQYQQQVNG